MSPETRDLQAHYEYFPPPPAQTELLGIFTLAPYGLRAMRIRNSLRREGRVLSFNYSQKERDRSESPVTTAFSHRQPGQPARGLRTPTAGARSADVYLPPRDPAGDKALSPVVIFVYGGAEFSRRTCPLDLADCLPPPRLSLTHALTPHLFIRAAGAWSSGDNWQYAPLAQALSAAGAVVVVPNYTLYPSGFATQMARRTLRYPHARPPTIHRPRGFAGRAARGSEAEAKSPLSARFAARCRWLRSSKRSTGRSRACTSGAAIRAGSPSWATPPGRTSP